jgi:hypothetical protein
MKKPPSKSWETWIEELIQEAQQAGEFERLEGAGKPIPPLDADAIVAEWRARRGPSE